LVLLGGLRCDSHGLCRRRLCLRPQAGLPGLLGETDERLDEMLASAATIREFDAKPAPPPNVL
jgi:hypothetical protein